MKEWTVEIRMSNNACPHIRYFTNDCNLHLNESGQCTFEDCPIKITPENI